MKKSIEDIVNVLKAFGGKATLKEIYSKLDYPESSIRRDLQEHSSDTETYKHNPYKEDLFFSVHGLRSGIWGLRNYFTDTQSDTIELQLGSESPKRKLITTKRIIRDTILAKEVKKIAKYECQLCGLRIELPNRKYYIEAHHIKPLGDPYKGPDIQSNILILCPNCHVKCDYKLIILSIDQIKNNKQQISKEYIDFHNNLYELSIE